MNSSSPTFPLLLQDFFAKRLIAQRQASPRTVASYRDTFRLFLCYAQAGRVNEMREGHHEITVPKL